MKVVKTYRYRIYPTSEQEKHLLAWESALRFLWNLALEQRLMGLARFKDDRKYYTAFDQINELTALRAELPWLAAVPRNVCAEILQRLDKAWKRCFEGLAYQPTFKRKGRDEVSFCEPHEKLWRIEPNAVVFPKLGKLLAVIHRAPEGARTTCTVVKDVEQWFACCSYEQEVPDQTPRPGVVALDRGVVNLVADSDGNIILNPRFAEKAQKRLTHAQRIMSRRKKGSRNREKAKLRVAQIFRKVRRQREHFLHRLSSHYAKSHGKVIVEDLKIANMTRSARGTIAEPGKNVRAKKGLNRSISGAGWGQFAGMLKYKISWNGGQLVEVDAAYSSQTCSGCGYVSADSRRSQSEFRCVSCGHREHADTNAAKVLKAREPRVTACGGIGRTKVSRRTRKNSREAASQCFGL